jgi:PRTRC genetic system protein A
MKASSLELITPIYLKLTPDMPWPTDRAFYLLSRDGLSFCRNDRLFQSCVPARGFPRELAGQEPFVRLNYPRVPQRLLETIIGFFAVIGARHNAEAAAVLVWNRDRAAIEAVVPPQVSLVSMGWGGRGYPMEVHYDVPPLPPHLTVIGDIHSHVEEAAYASFMDQRDETHRPGLHLVIGRISQEPPEFHIEMVVDGARFPIKRPETVLEGYERRRIQDVPETWFNQVTVKPWSSPYRSAYDSNWDYPSKTEWSKATTGASSESRQTSGTISPSGQEGQG